MTGFGVGLVGGFGLMSGIGFGFVSGFVTIGGFGLRIGSGFLTMGGLGVTTGGGGAADGWRVKLPTDFFPLRTAVKEIGRDCLI